MLQEQFISQKVLEEASYLQFLEELEIAKRSDFFSIEDYQKLMNRIINGVFDEEINIEIFEVCQKNYNNQVRVDEYIRNTIKAEDQLLEKIQIFSDLNIQKQKEIAEIQKQQELIAQNKLEVPIESYFKINIQSVEIVLKNQSNIHTSVDLIYLKLQSHDGFLRTSSAQLSEDQRQVIPYKEIFNILLQKEQQNLEIEVCGLQNQEEIVLFRQSVPLYQYQSGYSINQRIRTTCEKKDLAEACFVNIIAEINNDINGYYETLISQLILQQQENNDEKVQYKSDLMYIQRPYIRLANDYNEKVIKTQKLKQQNQMQNQYFNNTTNVITKSSLPPNFTNLETNDNMRVPSLPTNILNLSYQQSGPFQKAKEFIKDASNNKNQQKATQEEQQKQQYKINYFVLTLFAYFFFSVISCLDSSKFMDLTACCFLFLILINNAAQLNYLVFCQIIVFISLLQDLVYLYIHTQDFQFKFEKSSPTEVEAAKLFRGLERVSILVSFINAFIRVALIYYIHKISNIFSSFQSPFYFGVEPFKFQLGGIYVKNPLNLLDNKPEIDQQYGTNY
ncbi:transmembrane protein, putative (macronuclear) [Tetrahymena thermophila SB210]|uniref:Transmembrane protein, putative n=1 Tax=Tetrahymena thermophila (strain SB210) TaxID=312017 RepID=Q22T27_TETTS|nr:transmembrane protein, putative [Tetrahymena thermophila SB210]EAR88611.2 transmembrane protein, putative [Tetrahymena thermophila SB210]|eukprot:XP_001008856.2 transmembrane protein, putative [Tetrahymena thermophila SB210]